MELLKVIHSSYLTYDIVFELSDEISLANCSSQLTTSFLLQCWLLQSTYFSLDPVQNLRSRRHCDLLAEDFAERLKSLPSQRLLVFFLLGCQLIVDTLL